MKNLFLDNKYSKWYFQICNHARARKKDQSVRYERHHVVPRFMKGPYKEVVLLSIREHFVCHLLLTRMLVGVQRASAFYSLKAFTMCANGTRSTKNKSRNVELYRRAYENSEWKKNIADKVSKKRLEPETNLKIKQIAKDLWQDEMFRTKISVGQEAAWKKEGRRESHRKIMGSESVRASISEGTKAAMAIPATRRKFKARHAETQQNRTARISAAWADPIKKAARLAKCKATRAAKAADQQQP